MVFGLETWFCKYICCVRLSGRNNIICSVFCCWNYVVFEMLTFEVLSKVTRNGEGDLLIIDFAKGELDKCKCLLKQFIIGFSIKYMFGEWWTLISTDKHYALVTLGEKVQRRIIESLVFLLKPSRCSRSL